MRLMNEENHSDVREVSLNRLQRKTAVSSFILAKVDEMKTQSSTSTGRKS